ncbi:MAG: cytochrome c3 family protein [Bacteroidota bacterium]|nr:cytochrome c3 family protein [Bacteroidota bacterium]
MTRSFYRKYNSSIHFIFLISALAFNMPAAFTQSADTVYYRKTFTGEEITRGERLFYGLAYPADRAVNCSKCHNTIVSDTLNWNPDAQVISIQYKSKSALDLSNVLLKPTGKKMVEVHKGFQLTPEDITLIKAFMDKFSDIGLSPHKPVITNLFFFILASFLFLLAVTDLIITKRIKVKPLHYSILAITTVYIVAVLAVDAIRLGRTRSYAPDQPIKFSHAVHAGQNKTDCIYCHSYAHSSKVAGIPPVNVCMNCHLLVRSGTRSGTSEISKIYKSHDNNLPVRWIKVHNLPDHVFFSHAQHTVAGGIACSECHGKAEQMNIIVQISDLSMGWCINCHRLKKTSFRTNRFFTEYREINDSIKAGMIDTVTVEMLGGTECAKCHY